MHVSTSIRSQAFAFRRQNQSSERCSQSPSQARTCRSVHQCTLPISDNTEPPTYAPLNYAVFRDQLYKHLETVPEGDFDGYYSKLVQAGSTLEFLKYADAFYEIYFAGGLLQPGGDYVRDGAPPSPFSILKAADPAEVDDLKKYVDVLNKLIRR